MNRRFFLIAIVSVAVFAAAGLGQNSVPTAEQQMKVLEEKLDLSAEQQVKIKPILEQLQEAIRDIAEDQTLSRDERLAKARPHRLAADKKIREVLSAEQKKKLDQVEAEPHPELHGAF
jgi:Spy/CpxP family protein refolding chaperone